MCDCFMPRKDASENHNMEKARYNLSDEPFGKLRAGSANATGAK